jgi:uncharacterized integral membrane protein|tara:strand:- start:331 stop:549 length:219 start_codon:yes stop_codon:yes gene_type:complete
MGFFSFLLILSFSLIVLISYILVALNSEIISIDILFSEIDLGLGSALLSFLIIGSLITLILELINSYRTKDN